MSEPRHQARSRSARRLVAEGIAIVLSILLAFAIDAWWDGLQEGRRETELLGSLLTEFEANRRVLPGRIVQHGQTVSAATRIVASLRAAERGEFVTVADSSIMWSIVSTSFDPAQGTLDALLQSGDLNLITNDPLRAMLAAWPSQVEDARESEVMLRNQLQPEHRAILGKDIDVGVVLEKFRPLLTSGQVAAGRNQIRATTELLTVLGWVRFMAEEAAVELQALEAHADSIIAEIEAELDR